MNNDIKAKIIVKAWKDPAFKKKLLENPKAAFKEMGVAFNENYNVRCIEDKENTFTFVLPAQPSNVNSLSENELRQMVGTDIQSSDPIYQCPVPAKTSQPGCK